MIKVLVVDDSLFIRRVVREMLSQDKEIEIVGEASDGREAIEKLKTLQPDVVCLDIIMPMFDGFWMLHEIRRQCPTAVIIFSQISSPVAEVSAEAFRLGVIDIVQKPAQLLKIGDLQKELIEKIKLAAKVDREKLSRVYGTYRVDATDIRPGKTPPGLVIAIGSSAGGPPAVYELLSRLPKDIPASIIIAQHLPQHFIASFADHLKRFVSFPVKVAEDGDILSAQRVFVSPADKTARINRIHQGGVIQLALVQARVRPSIDTLFESVALSYGKNAIGVVLSGMGNDGTGGLRMIREKGGKTFVQDEKTSLIYGMPRAAAEAGVADHIVPIEQMADRIAEAIEGQ